MPKEDWKRSKEMKRRIADERAGLDAMAKLDSLNGLAGLPRQEESHG